MPARTAALTVISREQALRLFDEGKQIYLIRISPWPVLVTGREEIERGSDYFQIAKEDLEKDKQKAMENSEIAPLKSWQQTLMISPLTSISTTIRTAWRIGSRRLKH